VGLFKPHDPDFDSEAFRRRVEYDAGERYGSR
jgi:hypothetical protein